MGRRSRRRVQGRRAARPFPKGAAALALVGIAIAVAIIITLPMGKQMPTMTTGTGAAGDTFDGRVISPANFQNRTEGIVQADKDCNPVEGGLTSCKAEIETPDLGLLVFAYAHDMNRQQCLAKGQKVTVESAGDGKARVVRLGDLFNGRVVSPANFLGRVEGVVQADKDCKPVESGLTSCKAEIETKRLGLVVFAYAHDMHQQPCLASGDGVTVEDAGGGNAVVLRTEAASGG